MEGIHPLRAYRERQDPPLSQAGLAREIGVARATVHRWENGDRSIDTDLVPQISEKTGIPAKELRPDLAELIEPTPSREDAA